MNRNIESVATDMVLQRFFFVLFGKMKIPFVVGIRDKVT